MLIKTTFLALTLTGASAAFAQNFTALDGDLTPVYFPAMAVADVDGDGLADLVLAGGLADGTPSTTLYLGDGRGGFAEASAQSFVGVINGDIALGDVDGDGDVDVLLTGELGGGGWTTRFYRNDLGGFTEVPNALFPAGSDGAVAFSDVDADGDLDAVIASFVPGGDNGAGLFLNDGRGTFTTTGTTTFAEPFQATIAFADLDGDRDADLVIGGSDFPEAGAVYRNDGGGRFVTFPSIAFRGISFGALAVGDVDGDGSVDAVLSGREGSSDTPLAGLYLNDGAGIFEAAATSPFRGVFLGGIALTDVDGDRDLDAILTGDTRVGDRNEPATVLYLNDGAGGFAEAATQPLAQVYLSEILAADLDGDGDDDLVLSGLLAGGTAVCTVYRNNAPVSSVRRERGDPQGALRAWPNPVASGGRVSVAYDARAAGVVEAEVTGADGRTIWRRHLAVAAGAQTLEVELAGLAAGVYTVRLGTDRVRVLVTP